VPPRGVRDRTTAGRAIAVDKTITPRSSQVFPSTSPQSGEMSF
jgi:hypothetical protein